MSGLDWWNKWVTSLLRKMGNVCDNVTSSSRAFHVWAAATLNVLLPIVDSLNAGMTRQSVLRVSRHCSHCVHWGNMDFQKHFPGYYCCHIDYGLVGPCKRFQSCPSWGLPSTVHPTRFPIGMPGFPQTWKTWNSQGISLTWKSQGTFWGWFIV